MAIFLKTKLGEVAEIVSGGTPSSANLNYWENGNIFWATLPDLKNKYLYKTERMITEAGLKKSSAKLLPLNTVIFSSRATIGEVAITKVITSTNQGSKNFICNLEKVDPEFLYYSLKYNSKSIEQLASGATYKEINKTDLLNVEIELPLLSIQHGITSVLSGYDDLIENNEKRIKILEEMAQLLYTEWFVKFKFPGHEKVKLVDSGTEFGMIPEGWEVVQIESLLSKIKRKAKLKTSEYQTTGLYPVVDQGVGFIAGYTDNKDLVYGEDLIVFGDHSRCFKYCNFPFACGADGTQLLKTNDTERMPQILLYYSVVNAGLQNYNYARHFKFLKALKLLKPDQASASAFDSLVNQNYIQIEKLKQVNIVACKIRDLLIPQLVTGKRQLK